MKCNGCGKEEELRLGFCFDCAFSGEERASKRTVEQHLHQALFNLTIDRKDNAAIDIKWAYERLTETGDYAKGGTFDNEGYNWK